ncbi:amino acid ABC transporter substrate-binding protein [Thermosyntropha sp.]|uniref:amino acid ABC transporter substrate-binding protein n=1 Tax=Thermosyntropha sp. TaxID=2740820 RepID=UPI0025DD1788|nr:amino acid ABC transporter substrate-binding protein [Thermosyntropha sp.]MBO8158497.1 amino acid ABC transporter substrate-binding protein [Thermosyntropha sp.]
MRKKIALILVLCFTLAILLTGCGAKDTGSDAQKEDTSWEEIKEKGYFVVGLDDAFPPMGFRDENNEIVGFDVDLAKEVAKRLGVEVKFQPIVWETKVEELNGGNIDVIWNGFTITEERKKQVLFTKPYIEDHQIIVVRADSDIKTKEDLIGKKIGIQAASSAVDAVEDDPIYEKIKDNILEFESNDLALRDLKGGGVDAVVVDEVVGRYYISKHEEDYKILKDNFGTEEFGIGLRKTDKAFLAELEKVLDEMKKDGTAAAISQKWFGENIIKQ